MTEPRSRSSRASRSVFKAGDLGELINALPAMFGFPPENSLIALGMEGPRIVFGMRLDLADAGENVDHTAELAVRHLEHQQVEGAITLAIGEPLDLGRRLVLAVEERLIRVRPVAGGWATDDRFWVSMAGGSPRGYEYRRSLDHPAAAQAVWEGQEIAPSRGDVAASMNPVTGQRRARIEAAAKAAVQHFTGPLVNPGASDVARLSAQHVVPVLHDLRVNKPVPDEQLYRLGYLMTFVPIRDDAWGMITADNAVEFVRVWLHVARNVPHAWAPAAYSLAAFACWMCGDGAKSVMAAEHARRLDPHYSMAGLMLELATSGVSPEVWRRRAAS